MAGKVCETCGKEYENKTSPWYECTGCGTYHCPDCLQEQMDISDEYKQKKEREKEKQIEEAASAKDIETYKRKICPECEMELNTMI